MRIWLFSITEKFDGKRTFNHGFKEIPSCEDLFRIFKKIHFPKNYKVEYYEAMFRAIARFEQKPEATSNEPLLAYQHSEFLIFILQELDVS